MALDSHDRGTAAALLEPRWHSTVQREFDSMLTNVNHLRVLHIETPTVVSKVDNGPYAGWETTSVQVRFDPSQYLAESMPNGRESVGDFKG